MRPNMTHHRGHRDHREDPGTGSVLSVFSVVDLCLRVGMTNPPCNRPVALLAVLFAVSTIATLHAQTANVSIPAWVEANDCSKPPKFEAALNGKAVPVTAQLGPGSDQVILVVLDLTGDLTLVEAAKQALIAEVSKLAPNAWVGLLRTQDGLHVLADPGANRQPADRCDPLPVQ